MKATSALQCLRALVVEDEMMHAVWTVPVGA